jgi:hypothetical protein
VCSFGFRTEKARVRHVTMQKSRPLDEQTP